MLLYNKLNQWSMSINPCVHSCNLKPQGSSDIDEKATEQKWMNQKVCELGWLLWSRVGWIKIVVIFIT